MDNVGWLNNPNTLGILKILQECHGERENALFTHPLSWNLQGWHKHVVNCSHVLLPSQKVQT